MQNHQIKVHDMPLANTVNLGNTPINIIRRKGTVSLLHSSHFQALGSFITSHHSTWHTVLNLPAAQAKDIQHMGHRGKDMTCTIVVMAGLKRSPLRRVLDTGCHLQVPRECLQDRWEIIQSVGQYLPARLLHLNLLPAHLGDTPWASPQNESSNQQNRGNQMTQGLKTSPHFPRCPTTNIMQLMRATIRWTWAVQKPNPQSPWSKRSSPWSNLPKGWGWQTTVHSKSGRKYGWRGFLRRSIGPLSGGRTNWDKFEMDPCTGRQRSQIFWRHLRTSCRWLISIILNGFAASKWRCFRRNVQMIFKRRDTREGEATRDRRRIWESPWAQMWEVTSQSCEIQHSRLRFTGCQQAMILF